MLRKTILEFQACLEAAGVDSPRLCAELILAAALGCEREEALRLLVLEPERLVGPTVLARAGALLERRRGGEPMAYILGRKEFFGRDFLVGPEVLIPRPESEQVIEEALAGVAKNTQGIFADFGTGSGCLAVTLALELPAWRGLALDVSPAALAMARKNAEVHQAADRLDFVTGDFAAPLEALPALAPLVGRLDLLVSNPPYVNPEEYAELSREVRDFEPLGALVPGPSGMESHAAVLEKAGRLLKPGGLLIMEMGYSQGAALLSLLDSQTGRWSGTRLARDLAGLDRLILARRGG